MPGPEETPQETWRRFVRKLDELTAKVDALGETTGALNEGVRELAETAGALDERIEGLHELGHTVLLALRDAAAGKGTGAAWIDLLGRTIDAFKETKADADRRSGARRSRT